MLFPAPSYCSRLLLCVMLLFVIVFVGFLQTITSIPLAWNFKVLRNSVL